MKILVTGGAGFIGSAVIRQLIRETEATVVNLDKLTYAATPEALEDCADSPRYQLVEGDICDRALVASLFEEHQPDAVMHLAAESHVDRSIDGPGDFLQTNIFGTFTLLEAARAGLNELQAYKLRTALQLAGVTLGTASFILTVALLQGSEA